MKIYSSKINDKTYNDKKCGEIVDITKEGIVVKTSNSSIILKDIKPFGKKRMDAYSYVNGVGRDNLIGKVFE
jgi:methionyl-tRNA formyltransferase